MIYGTLKNVDELFDLTNENGVKKYMCKACKGSANGSSSIRKNHVVECQTIELSTKQTYLKEGDILELKENHEIQDLVQRESQMLAK